MCFSLYGCESASEIQEVEVISNKDYLCVGRLYSVKIPIKETNYNLISSKFIPENFFDTIIIENDGIKCESRIVTQGLHKYKGEFKLKTKDGISKT